MVAPSSVITSARKLIGTPYLHQGRLPQIGCDCLGVPILVGFDLDLFVGLPFEQKAIIVEANYPRIPDGRMRTQVEAICQPIVIAPGALLLFQMSATEQHCGIVSEYMGELGLIHAWDLSGVNAVVEHRLTQDWLAKITGCYALPGVDYE